jgi:hypothetical protein
MRGRFRSRCSAIGTAARDARAERYLNDHGLGRKRHHLAARSCVLRLVECPREACRTRFLMARGLG